MRRPGQRWSPVRRRIASILAGIFVFNAVVYGVLTPRFLKAVLGQDAKTITMLLCIAPDMVYIRNGYGDSPLALTIAPPGHHARVTDSTTRKSMIEACNASASVLIRFGADVNAQDRHGGCALDSVLFLHDNDLLRLMISRGANVNTREGQLQPILFAAIHDPRALQMFLDAGAHVNMRDKLGQCPLSYAVAAGKRQSAFLLRQYGAHDQNDPLLDAVAWGSVSEVDRQLTSHGAIDPEPGGLKRSTPLDAAVLWDRLDVLQLLISREPDAGSKIKLINGALYRACTVGSKRSAEFLFAQGGGANDKAFDGVPQLDRLLRTAAINDHPDLALLLIRKGAHVNPILPGGSSLLQWILFVSPRTAAILVARGADINVVDSTGRTLLTQAIEDHDLERVLLLIRIGADVKARGAVRPKPLRAAISCHEDEIASILQMHGAKLD